MKSYKSKEEREKQIFFELQQLVFDDICENCRYVLIKDKKSKNIIDMVALHKKYSLDDLKNEINEIKNKYNLEDWYNIEEFIDNSRIEMYFPNGNKIEIIEV